MIMVDFGERIKHLRTGMGLTQMQLSERVHISKAMMSSYETGSRLPSYDVLTKFAKIFGVSTDYLLGFDRIKVVDVSGITDSQVDLVVRLVNELKGGKH
jgi:transcriptional regulator with XRE-family HTH domain